LSTGAAGSLGAEGGECRFILDVGVAGSLLSTTMVGAAAGRATVTTAAWGAIATSTVTPATSTTSTTTTLISGLDELRIDVKEVLGLAFPRTGLVLGIASEVVLSTFLLEGLGVGPLLVLASSLIWAANSNWRAEVGLASGKFSEILVVGLRLLLLLGGGGGLGLGGIGGDGVRVGGVDASSVLVGEFLTGNLVVPLALTLVGTPSMLGLLLVLAANRLAPLNSFRHVTS